MTNASRWDAVMSALKIGKKGDVIAAWIYGGKALDPQVEGGDVDVMIVRGTNASPAREVMMLENGEEAHLNLVAPAAITSPEITRNGGLYFVGKLLAPRQLAYGDPAEARHLLGQGMVQMRRWADAVLNERGDSSAPSEVASLYLLKALQTPSFGNYLAKWFGSGSFEGHWRETVDAYAGVNRVDDVLSRSGGTVGMLPGAFVLEHLTAAWWIMNHVIRPRGDYLEAFFADQHSRYVSLGASRLELATAALQSVYRAEDESPVVAFTRFERSLSQAPAPISPSLLAQLPLRQHPSRSQQP